MLKHYAEKVRMIAVHMFVFHVCISYKPSFLYVVAIAGAYAENFKGVFSGISVV